MPDLLGFGLTFWFISLSGALSPGPLTAMALTEGARAGRWSGFQLALGHGIVETVLVIAVAYGLGGWLRLPLVGGTIGLLGAAFLLWMGSGLALGAWRGRLTLAAAEGAPPPSVMRLGAIPAGVSLSIANPYWSLWWATIGIAYIIRASALGPVGIVLFYLLAHWTTDLIWLTFLAWLVASGRSRINPQLYRGMLLACGLFLIVMSLLFAYTGWQSLRQAAT